MKQINHRKSKQTKNKSDQDKTKQKNCKYNINEIVGKYW